MGVDDFTPRLGRPGNRGAGAAKRYTARVKCAAKRLGRKRKPSGFTGARTARGTAAARMAQMWGSPFAKFRMRRVIVKVHIARANKGIGKAAFRAHVKYIQRDGVDRRGADERGRDVFGEAGDQNRDAGNLYSRDGEKLDDEGFLDRSAEDRHQFRIIVSPEDADQLGDLKESTRAFMVEVERDLGTQLDWVAVDHHNTGHPHTHIVIRGKDENGRDLVIARDYLTKGMRCRAQEIVMDRLGPRRDLDIARAQATEIEQKRWTGIDRRLADLEQEGVVSIEGAGTPGNRFERTLRLRRLKTLEGMGLASPTGEARWRMTAGWQDRLKALGRHGDIIRTLSHATGRVLRDGDVGVLEPGAAQEKITGRVLQTVAMDELRDTRAVAVETLDGKIWHVPTGAQAPGVLPPPGAIVEASPLRAAPKKSDRTVAGIAAINGGRYSAALHAADDPGASASYIEAHKRRLEALRRAGVVSRDSDGVWTIGKDYLARAAAFEAERGGAAKLSVKSWIDLDAQTRATAPVWLDTVDERADQASGFGTEVEAAKQRRLAFLKREGLWSDAHAGIDPARRDELTQNVTAKAAASEAARSGRKAVDLIDGASFAGTYEKPMTLATGRFALIAKSKEFALVPWRPELERHRGRMMTIKRTAKGVTWTLGRSKGISR
ncbi:MAG: DUF3363 domain-containing protein [Pseudomonadota bacterium]